MNSNRIETDYKPISCASYDEFEIAIMHHRPMHLTWQDGNVIYDQVVTPINLRTANGEEFLILRRADGAAQEVRLDLIRRAQTL